MSVSKIEWTDRTWNPVRGCSRVSEGCRNCYAEAFAARFSEPSENHPAAPAFYGFAEMTHVGPRWTGKVELVETKLREPLSWRKPQRVFVNSMSDLFHESLSDESIASVFSIMGRAPAHTFQVLTKRASRAREWFAWAGQGGEGRGVGGSRIAGATPAHVRATRWPLENVWLGVSVEDQKTADERIPVLLQTQAEKRFVSYEPALGPVNFSPYWLGGACWACGAYKAQCDCGDEARLRRLDWVIVGGESGRGARPFDVTWARTTVSECKAADVAVFVKQMGSAWAGHQWAKSGEEWDRKGGAPSEWPEDLRVREFPT